MKIFWRQPCGECSFDGLERIPRAFWMRALLPLRHYHCNRCSSRVLAPKLAVEERQWMMTTARNFRAPAPQDSAQGKS